MFSKPRLNNHHFNLKPMFPHEKQSAGERLQSFSMGMLQVLIQQQKQNYNFSNKGNQHLLKKRLNNNMQYTSVRDLPYAIT